jgi:hypothetical protein
MIAVFVLFARKNTVIVPPAGMVTNRGNQGDQHPRYYTASLGDEGLWPAADRLPSSILRRVSTKAAWRASDLSLPRSHLSPGCLTFGMPTEPASLTVSWTAPSSAHRRHLVRAAA